MQTEYQKVRYQCKLSIRKIDTSANLDPERKVLVQTEYKEDRKHIARFIN